MEGAFGWCGGWQRAAPEPRGGREAPAPWGRFGRCPVLGTGRGLYGHVSTSIPAYHPPIYKTCFKVRRLVLVAV